MGQIGKAHRELDLSGAGKCSVPMWMNGIPAGFCDKIAFGKPVPCKTFRDRDGRLRRMDGRYDGHVPALACPGHGGPKEPYFDVVFDGPPSHESGRFVEVENALGHGFNAGTWVERPDGFWALRIKRGEMSKGAKKQD